MLCSSKELVNFNCPLNQDLFAGEIGKLVTAVKLESQSTRRSPLPGATQSYPELPWFPHGEAILLASGRPRGQLVSPLLLQLGKSVSIHDHRNEMRRDESSQHWCPMVFHFCSETLQDAEKIRMRLKVWGSDDEMWWAPWYVHNELFAFWAKLDTLWHLASSSNVLLPTGSRPVCWWMLIACNVALGFHHRFCSSGSTAKSTDIAGNSHKTARARQNQVMQVLVNEKLGFLTVPQLAPRAGTGMQPESCSARDLRQASMFTIDEYWRLQIWKKRWSVYVSFLSKPWIGYRQWRVANERAHPHHKSKGASG